MGRFRVSFSKEAKKEHANMGLAKFKKSKTVSLILKKDPKFDYEALYKSIGGKLPEKE